MKRTTIRLWLLTLTLASTTPAAAQDDARIDEALARYRHEPSVDRIVEAALEQSSANPGRVRDAMDRARATGWLPTTRALVRRGQAVDLRALTGETTPTNVSTDDDLVLEARMTFHFDRIVYAPAETALLRELRATEQARARLSAQVVALYFERRRLQLERDLADVTDLNRRVRILELTALLDQLSGGALTRNGAAASAADRDRP